MKYKYRKNAELGEWYSVLLPLCLISFVFTLNNALYFLSFTICLWLCILDFLKTIIKRKLSDGHLSHVSYFIASLPISIFIWKFFSQYSCFFHAFSLCLVTVYFYNHLKTRLLKYCPGSFTLGEATILTQSITLLLITFEFSLFRKVNISIYISSVKDIPSHIKCLQVLLFGCLFLAYILHIFPSVRKEISFLSLFLVTSLVMLIAWHICLGQNIFSWLFMFCLQEKRRVYLILYWLACTFVSVLYVTFINVTTVTNGSTKIRKVFHFIITAVYVPGILYDLELLTLASGIAFAALLMFEICRIIHFPVIGQTIENAFKIFLDEKDTGVLILTHMYLLIGCSCPIWLQCYNMNEKGNHISLFSGIISVGVGDTSAAIYGKLFGRHKWKGSNKTIEGSLCSLIMQMIFAFYFLNLTGHVCTDYNIALLVSAVVLTTYLEARTNQVDNLVLPLFMFSILSWIK